MIATIIVTGSIEPINRYAQSPRRRFIYAAHLRPQRRPSVDCLPPAIPPASTALSPVLWVLITLILIMIRDLNDDELLAKLFDIAPFSHILHLATQTGVRYAIQNPQSYVKSNIAGFINLLEIAKNADPQPSIVWASSSSVYGLNTENPFSESRVAGGEQRK
uniref:NAD(P)-binding domain-containing protein n=1 Tax=Lactuca sativa TaxID=4236 RepID=A0A9R1WIT9_LACSA|nr:hypothetical protein LSAT_V11C100026690 [Lactuca sativa]